MGEWIGHAVDEVCGWWLAAFNDDDADEDTREALMEWWTTEAPDAALEIVHLVKQAIEDRGFEVVPSQAGAT